MAGTAKMRMVRLANLRVGKWVGLQNEDSKAQIFANPRVGDSWAWQNKNGEDGGGQTCKKQEQEGLDLPKMRGRVAKQRAEAVILSS